MGEPQHVYILWHGNDLSERPPEPKLLGVYSTETAAKDRIGRCIRDHVAGFAENRDDFIIDRYEIDRDEWVEGYIRAE